MARMVAISLDRIARRATLSLASIDPELVGADTGRLAECLLRDASTGHAIVPFWSAHQLTIALLTAERFGLGAVRERFEVVVDDSLGGEIMRHLGERFGLRLRRLHVRGDRGRFEDVGAWLRAPEPFFIAVDGGGPYGTVPTGIIRMAARLGSIVRPIAIRARPTVHLPGLVAEIPLPGAALALGIGAPMRMDRSAPIATIADELKQQLDLTSAAAGTLLGESTPMDGLPSAQRRSA